MLLQKNLSSRNQPGNWRHYLGITGKYRQIAHSDGDIYRSGNLITGMVARHDDALALPI